MTKHDVVLAGEKFQFLTALSSYKKNNKIYWTCLCDCGKMKDIRIDHLVSGATKSCGCINRKKCKLSLEQANEVCHLYIKEHLSSIKIGKIFNCHQNTIIRILQRNNILIRDVSHCGRKYEINENIFDQINTKEKAYWIGFLYADGSVVKNKTSKKLRLALAAKDISHLEVFSKFIYNVNRVKKYTAYVDDKPYPAAYVDVFSKYFTNKLCELGCVQNKTHCLEFPKWITKDLLHHFIRGYFDGDGSISISNNKACVSFTSNLQFLQSLQKIFDKKYIHSSLFSVSENKNTSTISTGGNKQVERLMTWLYQDATIFLTRKHDIFLNLKDINNDHIS
jgi:intein-encoded DNA endonuclease-like protein